MIDYSDVTVDFYDVMDGQRRFRVVGPVGKFVFIAPSREAALIRYDQIRIRREGKSGQVRG